MKDGSRYDFGYKIEMDNRQSQKLHRWWIVSLSEIQWFSLLSDHLLMAAFIHESLKGRALLHGIGV